MAEGILSMGTRKKSCNDLFACQQVVRSGLPEIGGARPLGWS
jgi:hypothetical protein